MSGQRFTQSECFALLTLQQWHGHFEEMRDIKPLFSVNVGSSWLVWFYLSTCKEKERTFTFYWHWFSSTAKFNSLSLSIVSLRSLQTPGAQVSKTCKYKGQLLGWMRWIWRAVAHFRYFFVYKVMYNIMVETLHTISWLRCYHKLMTKAETWEPCNKFYEKKQLMDILEGTKCVKQLWFVGILAVLSSLSEVG